ncbi:Zn(2)-C6 fungal-type domain-containing protein [Pseudozyma hubeiensis]|nr:Zn(2)-C6 fungal-type domain-containing protein [Pseudozyma hubeiensis]
MTASSSSSATAPGPTQSRRTAPSSTTNLSNDVVPASPAAAARATTSPSRAHTKEYSTELYDQNARHDHPSSRYASPSKPSKLGSSNPLKHSISASTPPPSRRKSNMNVDKAEKRRSSRACLECRLAKTKCRVTDSQDVCDRCAKFSFECRFVRHHRGRKPVSKLASMDADDVDLGVGSSRFGASDDDMATDHDSDSANEESIVKVDAGAANDDDDYAAEKLDATRALARDHDANAAGGESNQRKGREATVARPGASRSSSKARLHRAANSLHELDTNARRRIWEMLAQKIPQRGSTYTFVSKGEVAHDNLQASTSKSSSGKASSSGSKRASSPRVSSPTDGKDGDADRHGKVKAEDASAHASSAANASSQTASAPSQHFASTFRNLLRPVDKRAGATTAAEEAASAVTARYPRLPETLNLFGSKDPVDVGILSMAAAHRLYAYYFEHLNPWGMNFDPCFVSHDAVRVSSSFLYSTILYLASRYIELAEVDETSAEASAFYGATFVRPRPDDDRVTATISARLGSHVRSLAITAFAMGDRRMETGVAMYLSSVWKEADDHFTILYCSYAAKIMSDIPTELLSLLPSSSSGSATRSKSTAKPNDDATSAATLEQQRLRRNQQRQFLFHFIQEHTHLLHFAPRPNFDRGPSLLRNLLAWADDALATEDDILLCADIDSVLLQTKYKSIMERAQTQEKDTLYGGSECFLLLQSFMDELEGWTSRWELQARKIDQRFRRDAPGEEERRGGEQEDAAKREGEHFAGHLPLDARMHLLKVMRSSLVMQISSIAFRASLRDINKVKPSAASGKSSSAGGRGGASSSAFSPSALSAMDDRAEQIYYTCLDSALNLLVHTMQMPPSILRHAQDMIMVLAPHAALLATYLISLPLPSVPPAFASSAAAAESRLSYEYAKVKTRIRRRKEYERKCLELMRDTRESFRVAQVRGDDHVGLCAQYFDSLLNVIEGENQEGEGGGSRVGRSALGASNVVAGTKRSRSTLDQSAGMGDEEEAGSRGAMQGAAGDAGVERASSAGPASSRALQPQSSSTHPPHHHTPHHHQQHQPHHVANSTVDTSAAETLLNLHSTAEGSAENETPNGETTSPVASGKLFNGATSYYGTHPLSRVAGGGGAASGSTPPGFSPGSFISSGMFGHFAAGGGGGPNSPLSHANHQHHQQQQQYHSHGAGGGSATGMGGYPGAAGGDFGFATPPQGGNVLPAAAAGGTATPTGATGTSTPVDWTWLQSFLEVPEFSWM